MKMHLGQNASIREYTEKYASVATRNCAIDPQLYDEYGVKRGLRDKNGKGVLAGLTNISDIISSKTENGQSVPCEGELYYRGYDINSLINGILKDDRFGFEEIAYLLIMGELPDEAELLRFRNVLSELCTLPTNFVRDVVMKAPSGDMMNTLARSVLTLASYDKSAASLEPDNVLRQCLALVSVFPMLAVYGYHAYNHYVCNQSFYIHRPVHGLSVAQNILRMLRPDMKYSDLEAKVLDIALILHMEHGGGNNSTFTTHVVTSSGSDTYSTMAAALCSLKGPRHGGANIKVVEMMADLKKHVKNKSDEEEISAYLQALLHGEAFDRKGLIYGMGHAVYSISDPRAVVLRSFVESLSKEKHVEEEYDLYSRIERLAPEVIGAQRKIYKGVSANVDFYSGFAYRMLDLPCELYTPIFAIARITGWSAHRLEELINAGKIIRPAYMSISKEQAYLPLNDRT